MTIPAPHTTDIAADTAPVPGRRLSVAYPLVDAPAASERSPHTPAALTTHRTHREQLVRLYP